jgi:hypothetical protein
MSRYRTLLYSQDSHGGPLACTLASCHIARGCLTDCRLQYPLLADECIQLLDHYLGTGCARWRELQSEWMANGRPARPMRHAKEALQDDAVLGESLELSEEYWTTPAGHRVDGELVYEPTDAVLERWMDNPDESCCVVNSPDQFTYLVVPPSDFRGEYTVIDTHPGALENRRHAMPDASLRLETAGSGLIWSSLFESDVVRFVQLYCRMTGPDVQIDLSILRPRPVPSLVN